MLIRGSDLCPVLSEDSFRGGIQHPGRSGIDKGEGACGILKRNPFDQPLDDALMEGREFLGLLVQAGILDANGHFVGKGFKKPGLLLIVAFCSGGQPQQTDGSVSVPQRQGGKRAQVGPLAFLPDTALIMMNVLGVKRLLQTDGQPAEALPYTMDRGFRMGVLRGTGMRALELQGFPLSEEDEGQIGSHGLDHPF